ncbi:MAG: histidine--tRNA ligase [Gemmatimonadaceae bacterium]|jgi:histidyl-tRNA synthetase|nr:histidine--tRNA ligase [Gemmatimonadaceae bacterium]
MSSIRPLNGFREFPPDRFAERAHIFATWRRVAARYGFQEYDGPPLEPLELYTRKSGAEIVEQLYAFTDKGGREVALRPEMTPTVARMVAEQARSLRIPVRWFSVPQLFRYERAQRGRLREHFQLNCDLFGEAGSAADAEVLALVIDILREFGLTSDDVRVRLSDRRLLNVILAALGIGEASVPAVYAVLDKLERTPPDDSRAALAAAGVTASQVDALLALVRDTGARGADALRALLQGEEGAARLAALDETLAQVQALIGTDVAPWVRVDLTIVRGLAYYTGLVFEVFDSKGELRAVAGGGRYDTLLQSLGGVDMPAIGFGWGDVVLAELLRDRGLLPAGASAVEWWVAGDEGVAPVRVRAVAGMLRRGGARVEYALRAQKVQKQLQAAEKAGARGALVLRADGSARVLAWPSGEATTLDAAQLDDALGAVERGEGTLWDNLRRDAAHG